MNWANAMAWILKPHGSPPGDLLRYVGARVKVRTPRPKIKFPRGVDKRTNREILEAQLDDLCRTLYKARDIRDGYGTCISCGATKPAADLQWGHFIAQAQSQYLRWDPRNFGAQCVSCNIFQQGRQVDYGAELDRRHGTGFSEGLRLETKRYKTWHPSIKCLEDKKAELKRAILDFHEGTP